MKGREQKKKFQVLIGFVAALGAAIAGFVAGAEDVPFMGKDVLFTYAASVRPNVIFGLTDTVTLTRWAYPWEDGEYTNCTVTASCPDACGPNRVDWGNNNERFCPSYNYGLARRDETVHYYQNDCFRAQACVWNQCFRNCGSDAGCQIGCKLACQTDLNGSGIVNNLCGYTIGSASCPAYNAGSSNCVAVLPSSTWYTNNCTTYIADSGNPAISAIPDSSTAGNPMPHLTDVRVHSFMGPVYHFRDVKTFPGLGATISNTLCPGDNCCQIYNNRLGVTRYVTYKNNYTGDEWNAATSTIQSALYAMLFQKYDVAGGQQVRGYLTQDRYGGRIRWAFQKTNSRPHDGTPADPVLGDWYGPSPANRDGKIDSYLWGGIPHDGWGGCMLNELTAEPWANESGGANWQNPAPFSTDKNARYFRNLFSGGDTRNHIHYSRPSEGNLPLELNNYPKTFVPVTEMLWDAIEAFRGSVPHACYQARDNDVALHTAMAPAGATDPRSSNTQGRPYIEIERMNILGANSWPRMLVYPAGIGTRSASMVEGDQYRFTRNDDIANSNFLYANNFYLLFTSDLPLHDNYQLITHNSFTYMGGDSAGVNIINYYTGEGYQDQDRIAGNHDFSGVVCTSGASAGKPSCNPASPADLDGVPDNAVCAINFVNTPFGNPWYQWDDPATADNRYAHYAPACQAFYNWDETLGSNYLDDFAGLAWSNDWINDPNSSYLNGGSRSTYYQGNNCEAIRLDVNYPAGQVSSRASDCKRQSISVDVISMEDAGVYRNAALNSMGRFYAVKKPHVNKGYYQNPTTEDRYYVAPDSPYYPQFGRDCENTTNQYVDDCYLEGTIARAFNNWFHSLPFRNVEIDKPYQLVPPAVAVDPYSPGYEDSTAVVLHTFVPTPSSLYEGRLFMFNSNVFDSSYNQTVEYATNRASSFDKGGVFKSHLITAARLPSYSAPATWQATVNTGRIKAINNNSTQLRGCVESCPVGGSSRQLSIRVEDAGALLAYKGTAGATFSSTVASRLIYTENGGSMVEVQNVINDIAGLDRFKVRTGNAEIDYQRRRTLLKRIYNGIRSYWEGGDFLASWRLGDSVNFKPQIVGIPNPYLSDNVAIADFKGYNAGSYLNYLKRASRRDRMVYMGTNDGILHAFKAGSYDGVANRYRNTPPDEAWAYLPPPLLDSYRYRVTAWEGGNALQSFYAGGVSSVWNDGNIIGSWNAGWQFGSWQAGRFAASTVVGRQYGIDATPTIAEVWIDSNGDGDKQCTEYAPGAAGALTTLSANCEWHTILMGGLGRGGRAYYALDVSNPATPRTIFASPFAYDSTGTSNYGSQYLAYTTSEPAIGRIKVLIPGGAGTPQYRELWIAAFGLGWHATGDPHYTACSSSPPAASQLPCYDRGNNSVAGRGIAIINLNTGAKLYEAYYTPGGSTEKKYMYFSAPGGAKMNDADGDGFVDAIYWGDLGGQLWRIRTDGYLEFSAGATVNDPAARLKECNAYTDLAQKTTCLWPQRLFAAPRPDGSITTVPASAFLGLANKWHSIWGTPAILNLFNGVRYIGFGTGDKANLVNVSTDDYNPTKKYMFIGVRDNFAWDPANLPVVVSAMGANYTVTNVDANPSSQGVKSVGWYLNLPLTGERITESPVVYNSNFVFTSFTPDEDFQSGTPLNSTLPRAAYLTRETIGYSYIYAIKGSTGGSPPSGFFASASSDPRRGAQQIEGYASGVVKANFDYSVMPSTVGGTNPNPNKVPTTVLMVGGSTGTIDFKAPPGIAGGGEPTSTQPFKDHLRMLYWHPVTP